MENLGTRIANLRKEQNITQAELGKKLNISAQAVSKWENGLSEPDIETVTKLCEIFQISFDSLVGKENPKTEETAVTATEDKTEDKIPVKEEPVITVINNEPVFNEDYIENFADKVSQRIPVGVCSVCGSPIYDKVFFVEDSVNGVKTSAPYCERCKDKRELKQCTNSYDFNKSEFNRGIFWGIFAGVVLFIAALVYGITQKNYGVAFGVSFAVLAFGFLLVSQICWEGTVSDVFEFFCRSFRMPGLIFDLSLDGIIWFITVKLALGILSIILSVIVFLFGCVISAVISAFTFPFCITSELKDLNEEKRKIEILKKKIQGEII